ncbi:MAG: response regulator transcription factor [Treponema sp.]|uniref:response regulator transcription factor n=1 Tax=Treponema sp. TaxID=166 RepID=UPI0025FAE6D3|nr:LuxR C-terminal-related transcriptional regulator [Treponema sp.]MBR0496707.1 response regulator transcription factor [Treponema sp.]
MKSETDEKAINAILIEIKRLENMICDLLNASENSSDLSLYLEKAAKNFSLSEREFDVLKLIADGRSNNEISEKIEVSVSTVKKHIYNIFNKAGVNSRTQLLNLVYSLA